MGDTLVLHNGDIEIRLAVASESAGEQAEEFIKKQVEGTCGHFYQVETGVVDVKTNLLYQIGRARSFVLVEYAFDVEEDTPDLSAEDAAIPESFAAGDTGAADSISYRMFHWKFTVEQKEEVKRAMAVRVPKEVILS